MALDVDLAELLLAGFEVHAHVDKGCIDPLKVLNAADLAGSEVVSDRIGWADAVRRSVRLGRHAQGNAVDQVEFIAEVVVLGFFTGGETPVLDRVS